MVQALLLGLGGGVLDLRNGRLLGLGRTQQDLAELSAVLGLDGHGLERRAYIVLELADMGGFTRLAERRTFSGFRRATMLGRTEPALELVGLYLPNLLWLFTAVLTKYCLRYRLTALLAA